VLITSLIPTCAGVSGEIDRPPPEYLLPEERKSAPAGL
jgi:hypothetical protein